MAGSADKNARCSRHNAAPAGWRCDACKKYLCPDCTARVLTQFYCCLCEGSATQLSSHRSERPLHTWVVDSITYPLRRGLIQMVIVAAFLTTVSVSLVTALDPEEVEKVTMPVPAAKKAAADGGTDGGVAAQAKAGKAGDDKSAAGGKTDPKGKGAKGGANPDEVKKSLIVYPPARAFVLYLFAFLIVFTTARGGRVEPGMIVMGIKAVVASVIVWAPGAAYLVFVQKGLPDGAVVQDFMAWLFAGLALIYLPMVLAGSAGDGLWLEVINPFKLFEWTGRMGRRYLFVLLCLAAFCGVAFYLGGKAGDVLESVHVPMLNRFLAELVGMVAFVIMARFVGWVLFIHGEAFDWGMPAQFRDPLLKVDANGTRKRVDPIGGADSGAVSVDGKIVIKEKPEPLLAKDVKNCLEDGNMARALKLFEARAEWTDGLFNDRQLFDLGVGAQRAKKYAVAERAFIWSADKPGTVAVRAQVSLAKLYEEVLKQPDKARAAYERVIEKFPGSDMAKVAENRLKILAGGTPPPAAG